MALQNTNMFSNKPQTLNGRRQPAFSSRYKVKKISQDQDDDGTDVLIQYFINEVMNENNETNKDHVKFMVEVLKSNSRNQIDDEIQEDTAMKAKLDAMSSAAIQIEAAMSTAAALSSDPEDKAASDMQVQLDAISAAAAKKAAQLEASLNVDQYEKEAIDYAEKKVSDLENAMKMASMSKLEDDEKEAMKVKLAEISATAAKKAAALEASMNMETDTNEEEVAMKIKLAEISAAAANKAATLGKSFF